MTDVGNLLIYGKGNRPIISEPVRTTKVLNYKDSMVDPHDEREDPRVRIPLPRHLGMAEWLIAT
jgi:hypothetical protein